jgi:hypothetical protein
LRTLHLPLLLLMLPELLSSGDSPAHAKAKDKDMTSTEHSTQTGATVFVHTQNAYLHLLFRLTSGW